MAQSFTAQASEVVIEKEIELPRELRFVKRQATGNRLGFVCALGCLLDFCDQRNRLLLVFVAEIFGFVIVNMEQLPITQILLNDDSSVAVNGVDLRNRNITVQKQPGHVEIRMKFGIERLRIDGGYGSALLPTDTIILAR